MNAAQYGMEHNEFAKAVEEAGQVPAMVGEVARRKALALVLEKAVVTDASGRSVDLEALTPKQPEIALTEQDLSAGDAADDAPVDADTGDSEDTEDTANAEA
jgi:trigger factor